jgi:hypothetical protein
VRTAVLGVAGRRDEEAAGLATERHTTAFVVGLVLGGLAGAAVTLWKTPRSGAQLRALVAERTEEVLFRLTGMDEAQTWGASDSTPPASFDRSAGRFDDAEKAAAVTAPLPALAPEPADVAPDLPVEDDDGATLPATFRGEVLTDQPTDIVLDGPRPAPADR